MFFCIFFPRLLAARFSRSHCGNWGNCWVDLSRLWEKKTPLAGTVTGSLFEEVCPKTQAFIVLLFRSGPGGPRCRLWGLQLQRHRPAALVFPSLAGPPAPPHQSHPTAKALECVWTIVRMFVPGTPSHNLLCPLPVLTTKMDAIFCPVGVGILGDGVRSYRIWCKMADLWMLFFILLVHGHLATFKRFSDLISEKAAATRQSGSGGCRRGNLVIF